MSAVIALDAETKEEDYSAGTNDGADGLRDTLISFTPAELAAVFPLAIPPGDEPPLLQLVEAPPLPTPDAILAAAAPEDEAYVRAVLQEFVDRSGINDRSIDRHAA